jgi:hypothetical protein
MKYIITESQYQTLLEQRKYRSREEIRKEKEEYQQNQERFLKREQSKLSEMQSLVDSIVSEYHEIDDSLIIVKCEIINLLFNMYQSNIYLYFNIEYKGSDEEYTNYLKNSFETNGQPWRDIHTFFSFMKEKFHNHYIQTNEKIGFNPHSCEYDVV